jgi:hypothetical protein
MDTSDISKSGSTVVPQSPGSIPPPMPTVSAGPFMFVLAWLIMTSLFLVACLAFIGLHYCKRYRRRLAIAARGESTLLLQPERTVDAKQSELVPQYGTFGL